MFYGPILQEVNQRQKRPIATTRVVREVNIDFDLNRNNFNGWLRSWKMSVPEGYQYRSGFLQFAQKTKTRFINLIENEIASLESIKTQFGLLVKFSIVRDEKTQYMEHYFAQRGNAVFTRNNEALVNRTFNRFIDEVKGEIEAWIQRGSGWVIEGIVAAYVNVERYEPLRGGSYMPLPKNLQNKKAIINVQNRDNQCLRWAIRAALFPALLGVKVAKTSSYPTEDGLNFAGIDFPTPVSQIVKLERQNPNLAINVFGWEKDNVTVPRISEKDGSIPRINLMVTHQGENIHYSYVKRLTALLYDQSKNSNSKHVCERCLQGYSKIDLLERQTRV